MAHTSTYVLAHGLLPHFLQVLLVQQLTRISLGSTPPLQSSVCFFHPALSFLTQMMSYGLKYLLNISFNLYRISYILLFIKLSNKSLINLYMNTYNLSLFLFFTHIHTCTIHLKFKPWEIDFHDLFFCAICTQNIDCFINNCWNYVIQGINFRFWNKITW